MRTRRRWRKSARSFGSIFSHILRDATRTGILCYPIGVTEPIPYILYLLIIAILPRLLAAIVKTNGAILKPQYNQKNKQLEV